MSKLTIIRQSLETNPEVVIVSVSEMRNFDSPYSFNNAIDFMVAPKKGLYTIDELQAFMIELIPKGLEPTNKEDFYKDNFFKDDRKNEINLGRLYFDEDLGQEKITRICTLTDEELLKDERLLKWYKFVNGQRTIEETIPYQRRTVVKLFPSVDFVKDILEERLLYSEYHVTQEEFKRYQPGLIQRWINKR